MTKKTPGAGPVHQRVRLAPEFAGAKFRPVTWHALTDDGTDLKGYGIEVMPKGKRRYRLCALHGDSIPFNTEKEADDWCAAANAKAQAMLSNTADEPRRKESDSI
jgi:hypothetical protein